MPANGVFMAMDMTFHDRVVWQNVHVAKPVKQVLGEKCGGKLRGKVGRCQRQAGWGTDHVGMGLCKLHGGSTPTTIRSYLRPSLELLVGHSVNVTPTQAILMCIRIAAAEVMYFSERIATLQEKDIQQSTMFGKQLNMWIKERQKSADRLLQYSATALKIGIEERLVRVAEQFGQQLGKLIKHVLDGLMLTDEQQQLAPALVRSALATHMAEAA